MEKSDRRSGVELLRIVAMAMVLILHVNRIGFPNPDSIHESTFGVASFRLLLESLCIVAVNSFVIISGWFGIKSSVQGLLKLLFQCIYFGIVLVIVETLTGGFSRTILLDIFVPGYSMWFVKSYVILYILSPSLNKFVEVAEKNNYLTMLILFYVVQFTYGFGFSIARDFNEGYSAISFIGLYLLAQYIKKYVPYTNWTCSRDVFAYAIISVGITIVAYVLIYFDLPGDGHIFAYNNPFVILSSFSIFFAFLKFDLHSVTINSIASSVFSVYLLQHVTIFPKISESIVCSSGFTLFARVACLLLLIIAFYISAIALDQPRRFLWNFLSKYKF